MFPHMMITITVAVCLMGFKWSSQQQSEFVINLKQNSNYSVGQNDGFSDIIKKMLANEMSEPGAADMFNPQVDGML